MLTVDANNTIVLTKGDSGSITVAFTDSSGNTYDASGDTVEFGVKRNVYDAECVLKKTVENGTTLTFTPEDTEDIEGYGDFLYDIQITHVTEAQDETEEDVTEIWTPIAAAKFVLGWNVL